MTRNHIFSRHYRGDETEAHEATSCVCGRRIFQFLQLLSFFAYLMHYSKDFHFLFLFFIYFIHFCLFCFHFSILSWDPSEYLFLIKMRRKYSLWTKPSCYRHREQPILHSMNVTKGCVLKMENILSKILAQGRESNLARENPTPFRKCSPWEKKVIEFILSQKSECRKFEPRIHAFTGNLFFNWNTEQNLKLSWDFQEEKERYATSRKVGKVIHMFTINVCNEREKMENLTENWIS